MPLLFKYVYMLLQWKIGALTLVASFQVQGFKMFSCVCNADQVLRICGRSSI
jgi:hypothetical protein